LLTILVVSTTPLLALAASYLNLPPAVAHFLLMLSPAYAWFSLADPLRGLPGFWISSGVGHACAWLLLWWTCRLLPRVWQDQPATARQARRRSRVRDFIPQFAAPTAPGCSKSARSSGSIHAGDMSA
jgi:hypothetical protein